MSKCANPESLLEGGGGVPILISFFKESEALEPQKAGNYWPVKATPLKWRFAGGPIMAHFECWLGSFNCDLQGIWTSTTRKPYKFVTFSGNRTPCPPLDPRMELE